MKPKLRLGRSFDNINIECLIQVISTCSQRVILEPTDINMKGILEKSKAYIKRLQKPQDTDCKDFIEVVRASGCHQLIDIMLQKGADFSQLVEKQKTGTIGTFEVRKWEEISEKDK